MKQFNYSALLGLIREKGHTQESLAKATGICLSQLNRKLNGQYPFKQTDIQSISDVLGIVPADIGRFFFAKEPTKVDNERRTHLCR